MVGVDVFRDWALDLWIHWSDEYCMHAKVALNFLFRLNVKHVGRMNAELVGSIGRLSEQWTRWLDA